MAMAFHSELDLDLSNVLLKPLKLEGLFTVLVAGIFAVLFPGTPKNPKSLADLTYFSEREIRILRQRIRLDDPTNGTGRKTISLKELTSTV
jgi:MFS transporter, ACS family, DAL5 transporter family protein